MHETHTRLLESWESKYFLTDVERMLLRDYVMYASARHDLQNPHSLPADPIALGSLYRELCSRSDAGLVRAFNDSPKDWYSPASKVQLIYWIVSPGVRSRFESIPDDGSWPGCGEMEEHDRGVIRDTLDFSPHIIAEAKDAAFEGMYATLAYDFSAMSSNPPKSNDELWKRSEPLCRELASSALDMALDVLQMGGR